VFEEGDEGKGKMIDRFLGDNISLPLFKPKKDSIKPDGTEVRGIHLIPAAAARAAASGTLSLCRLSVRRMKK
jgi:hypothetical protein